MAANIFWTREPTRRRCVGRHGYNVSMHGDRAPLLARAATAAGVHALFIECHPEPKKGMSDSSTMLPLDTIPALLKQIAAIHLAMK